MTDALITAATADCGNVAFTSNKLRKDDLIVAFSLRAYEPPWWM